MIHARDSSAVPERVHLDQQLKSICALRSARILEWPQSMRGHLAWDRSSLPSENSTVLTLTADEVEEVKGAVRHFNRESF